MVVVWRCAVTPVSDGGSPMSKGRFGETEAAKVSRVARRSNRDKLQLQHGSE